MNGATQALTLPPLREDLQLIRGAVDSDGTPTWRIFDPVQNRYFQIRWGTFQLLSNWHRLSVSSNSVLSADQWIWIGLAWLFGYMSPVSGGQTRPQTQDTG